MTIDDATVGDELPPLRDPAHPHADRRRRRSPPATTRTCTTTPSSAGERGSPDIFMNILTTNGFVGRYITDWAGPRRRAPQGRDPARRAQLPGRHDDADRRRSTAKDDGDRRRSRWSGPTASATTSPARSRSPWPPSRSVAHERDGMSVRATSRRARPRSSASAPPSSPRTPAAASCSWPCEAVRAALDDAGLEPADVDGMVTFTMDTNPEIESPRRPASASCPSSPASTTAAARPARTVQQAALAVATGRGRRRGLLPGVQRALGAPLRLRRAAPREPTAEGAALGWYAALRAAHPGVLGGDVRPSATCTTYGATSRGFGRVAVADRKHAATNPAAWFYEQADHARGPRRRRAGSSSRCACSTAARRPTAARRSSSPASSGRATCRSRPRSSPRPPRARARDQEQMTSFYRDDDHRPPGDGPGRPAAVEHDRARRRPTSDVAILYDHFTPFVLMQLEEFGFCGRGEAEGLRRRGRGCRSTPTAGSSARRTSTG